MNPQEQVEADVSPARLGKEVKIGLAVIAGLFVILAVLAGVRIFGWGGGAELAVAEPPADAAPMPDKSPALAAKSDRPPADSRRTTFLPAKPHAEQAPQAKELESRLEKWKQPPAKLERPQLPPPDEGVASADPPAFVPEMPKPPAAKPRESKPPADKPAPSPWRDRYSSESPSDAGFATADSGDRVALPPPPRGRQPRESRDEMPLPDMPVAPHAEPPIANAEPPRRIHRPPDSWAATTRRDDGKHEVLPNDSFWTIAERVYGDGGYFKALVEHNHRQGVAEDRLMPGEFVFTPPRSQLEADYPDLCPKPQRQETPRGRDALVSDSGRRPGGRTYVVAEGDTLFDIARYELGKASRWAEIYELNRDVLGGDFNYLRPGTKLLLPDGEQAELLAKPPDRRQRR